MFSIAKAQDMKNFSDLCRRHMLCTRWNTFTQIFALSAKLCVSGLMDDLSSIDEYFLFVSSEVTIYNGAF